MTPREEARLQYAKDSVRKRPPDEIAPTAIIHSSALIGMDGFGWARDYDGTLVKMQHAGNVIIGKNVEIGPFTTVDRAVNGSTVIGDGTKIQCGVNIGHGAKIGKNCIIVTGTVVCGGVEVGDNTWLGVNCSILQKVKIGNNCMIGMGAIVLSDVPDNTTVKGVWKGLKKVEVKYTIV